MLEKRSVVIYLPTMVTFTINDCDLGIRVQGRIADTDDEEEDAGIMLLIMHEWDKSKNFYASTKFQFSILP